MCSELHIKNYSLITLHSVHLQSQNIHTQPLESVMKYKNIDLPAPKLKLLASLDLLPPSVELKDEIDQIIKFAPPLNDKGDYYRVLINTTSENVWNSISGIKEWGMAEVEPDDSAILINASLLDLILAMLEKLIKPLTPKPLFSTSIIEKPVTTMTVSAGIKMYAILRTKKHKSLAAVSRSAQHKFREQPTPNANPDNTHRNKYVGAESSTELVGELKLRLPEKRRKDAVI